MMSEKDYSNFSDEDFLQDDYFLRWMQNDSPENNLWWESWLSKNEGKRKTIFEAQKKYQLMVSFGKYKISDKEEKQAWKNILQKIDYPVKKSFNFYSIRWIGAAAALVILLTFLTVYKTFYADGQLTTIVSNSVRRVQLQDGSLVILDKGASLRTYSGINREVWLKGQAFFEITKVKDRAKRPKPFLVHADNFTVTVTGTSFMVTNKMEMKRVILSEGRVSVEKHGETAVMKPGDRLSLNGQHFIKDRVNTSLYSAWKNQEFEFDNTSISDLEILVRNVYGLELVVKEQDKLRQRKLNGVVDIASRNNFIKTIEILLDANIRCEHNRLIIEPKY